MDWTVKEMNNTMIDGQKYLLLRYSTKPVKDCIEKHQEIIKQKGYCWFGKIGNIPSGTILNQVFDCEQPILLLYQKGAAFLCKMQKFTLAMPDGGCPDYYQTEGIEPTILFQLTSIEPCDTDLLHNSIVVSTGAYVEDVVYHSRIPFMLCAYVDESKLERLAENECRYKKDELCNCRTCVNYGCLCERPRLCVKQRR